MCEKYEVNKRVFRSAMTYTRNVTEKVRQMKLGNKYKVHQKTKEREKRYVLGTLVKKGTSFITFKGEHYVFNVHIHALITGEYNIIEV